MKRVYPFIVAAVLAGMAVVPSPSPALACGMGHAGPASAPPEQSERVADLRAKLQANGAAIAASQDQTELLELLKERTQLQDALLAEVMGAPGRRADSRRSPHQH